MSSLIISLKRGFKLSNAGMSLMDMVGGLAIFGLVSVVSVKNFESTQKSMKNNEHKIAIEAATKSLSDAFKKQDACERIIANFTQDQLNAGVQISSSQQLSNDNANKECVKPEAPAEVGDAPQQYMSDAEWDRYLAEWAEKYCTGTKESDAPKSEKTSGFKDPVPYVQNVDYSNCGIEPKREGLTDEQYDLAYQEWEDSKKEYQRQEEQYQRELEAYAKCGGSGVYLTSEGVAIDLSRVDIDVSDDPIQGLNLNEIDMQLENPPDPDGNAELVVTLEFQTRTGKSQGKRILREIRTGVQVVDGKIQCNQFSAEDIATDDDVCGMLGGERDANGDCTFPSGLNGDLANRLKLAMCDALDNLDVGSMNNGVCDRIELERGLNTQNIGTDHLVINNQRREEFDNEACENGYLKGYEIAGQKQNCAEVVFNFSGGASPSCDLQDGYYLSGTNTAAGTATCTERDYSLDGAVCRVRNVRDKSAGVCEVFEAGTCSGSTDGILSVVPNGTVCGDRRVCSNGACIDTPKCSDTYSLAGIQSATDTSYCDKEERSMSADFSVCEVQSIRIAEAGICKQFAAGTCNGATGPTIENVPNGTDCGGGLTCQNGVCGSDICRIDEGQVCFLVDSGQHYRGKIQLEFNTDPAKVGGPDMCGLCHCVANRIGNKVNSEDVACP